MIVPRGVTHELVRHRVASYIQESTRYCDYKGGVEFIQPWHIATESDEYTFWTNHMQACEDAYLTARDQLGWKPELARGLLPIDLKSEIIRTTNFTNWAHFFRLRAAKPSHPQMRIVACDLLKQVRARVPIIFDDVGDADCAPEVLA